MFNPLDHPGLPPDRQLRSWRELNVDPIDPRAADPYTRCRIITLNGIEVEAILFSHNFSRVCADPDIRRALAEIRYIEAQDGEKPPSERVIDAHRAAYGDEYRVESEGPHPGGPPADGGTACLRT